MKFQRDLGLLNYLISMNYRMQLETNETSKKYGLNFFYLCLYAGVLNKNQRTGFYILQKQAFLFWGTFQELVESKKTVALDYQVSLISRLCENSIFENIYQRRSSLKFQKHLKENA